MQDQTTQQAPEPATGTSRRRFLTYVVGGTALTVATPLAAPGEAEAAGSIPDYIDFGDILNLVAAPTSHLLVLDITPEGKARLFLPRAEVGQGITTTMAIVVAEELDLPVSQVEVPLSDARVELVFNQFTGASNSVRSLYDPVRRVAAAARARLLAAAAADWKVSASTLSVSAGTVRASDGRTATYGALTAKAAALSTTTVTAKPKTGTNRLAVGQPTGRIDARAIVTGQLEYALDLDIPNALPAMIRRGPTLRSTVRTVNNIAAVKGMPGVVDVVELEQGVGVIAKTFGQAWDAKDALDVVWNAGTIDNISDVDIRQKLIAASLPLGPKPPLLTSVDAEFEFAFVPHAPLETNAAVANVAGGKAEIWTASQSPIIAKEAIALALGLPISAVTLHVTQAGGSFGRRLFYDGAMDAALLSRKAGRPVRLMWTRIDDMRHGRARPATHHKLRATTALGRVIGYTHRMSSVETDFKHGLGEAISAAGASLPWIGSIAVSQLYFATSVGVPYHFGLVNQTLNEVPLKMNTGSWRSVYSGTARGCEEILVDEVAAAVGKDPVQFRREHAKEARARAVLDKVASVGGWGKTMPAGFAQGVGLHEEYRSAAACLVEIDARDPKKPRVVKAVIAVDVGLAINPKGLQAQMLGGLTDAITIVTTGGLHIDKGLPLEGSYSQFHYPRMRHTPPAVQVIVMPSEEKPGGAGELAVPCCIGAVANAYARATKTKPRKFPLNFPVDFEPFPR